MQATMAMMGLPPPEEAAGAVGTLLTDCTRIALAEAAFAGSGFLS